MPKTKATTGRERSSVSVDVL